MPIWIFLLLLFSSPLHAERLLERLCFTNTPEAEAAIPILNTVLIKGQDEILNDGPCLNVFVEDKRGELFERWVKSRLPHARSTFSTKNAPVSTCDMELKKTTYKEEVIFSYDANGKIIGARAGKDVLQGEEKSFLATTSGKPASLLVDQNQVDILCTKKNNDRYLINISVKTVPRTIPNVYNPSQPIQVPPEEATALSTELEVGLNQEINLGEVVKDLNKDSTKIDIPTGVGKIHQLGLVRNTWVLTIR